MKKRISNLTFLIKRDQIVSMKSKCNLEYGEKNYSSGFTLVELMIVMTLIGILATMTTVVFGNVGSRSRDAERKSDISQIQTALELYRSDSGQYPLTSTYSALSCNTSSLAYNGVTYIAKLPCDPKTQVKYTYTSDGTIYTILNCLENKSDNDRKTNTVSTSVCSSTKQYSVSNP